jgi:hypothetical protein
MCQTSQASGLPSFFKKIENKELKLFLSMALSVCPYWDSQLAICKIFIDNLSFYSQHLFWLLYRFWGKKCWQNTYDVVLIMVPHRDVFFTNYDPHPPNRLCGLVVRVLGYRSGGPGSIPSTTRFSEEKNKKENSSGSGTGSTQPREYNWGATW